MKPDDGMLERLGIGKDIRISPTQEETDRAIEDCKNQLIQDLGQKILEADDGGKHSASIEISAEKPELSIVKKAVEAARLHFASMERLNTSIDHKHDTPPSPDQQTGELHTDSETTHYFTIGIDWQNI